MDLYDKPIKWDRVRQTFFSSIEDIEDLTRKMAFDRLREFAIEQSGGYKGLEDEYYQTLEPDLEDWLEENLSDHTSDD